MTITKGLKSLVLYRTELWGRKFLRGIEPLFTPSKDVVLPLNYRNKKEMEGVEPSTTRHRTRTLPLSYISKSHEGDLNPPNPKDQDLSLARLTTSLSWQPRREHTYRGIEPADFALRMRCITIILVGESAPQHFILLRQGTTRNRTSMTGSRIRYSTIKLWSLKTHDPDSN